MLIEFSVENFKSFKELETLSLNAGNLKPKYAYLDVNNLIKTKQEGIKGLKSKGIYGANASGKSNVYKAMQTFQTIVKESLSDDVALSVNHFPFKLDSRTEEEPTFFQIQLLLEGSIYRYGFVYDGLKIHSEWLFKREKREVELFTREGNEISFNKKQFSEGKFLKEAFEDSHEETVSYLFLSALGKFAFGHESHLVYDFIVRQLVLVSGLNSDLNKKKAELFIEDEKQRKILVDLVKSADVGINDIEYVEVEDSNEPTKVVYATKKALNENGEESFNIMFMDSEESKGTQKMFELSPYIINCLQKGGVLFIDEFDSRFHSLLTQKIIELFNSESNAKGQLIFITHDTNLLSSHVLRRDQISFVERDEFGCSHMYSLAEFKGVRNSASYENDYINGKYGAIPLIHSLEEAFEHYGKED